MTSPDVAAESAGRPAARPGRALGAFLLVGLFVGPLVAFVAAFLVLPAATVLAGAFQADSGALTLEHVRALLEPQHLAALRNSLSLSAASAGLGAVCGFLVAHAVTGPGSPAWLRGPLTAFCGVAANFAGVPLALAFVATLGTTGLVTRLLAGLGLNLYGAGFSLFSFTGLVLVYLYFQIPLMVIVITPALEGLRLEWREAAENLGASRAQFWRMIGFPLLAPSLLAAGVLLFGNAFAAYATPYALTSGVLALLPLEIGAALSGNVSSEPRLGQALAVGVIAVMSLAFALYSVLERLGSRWRR